MSVKRCDRCYQKHLRCDRARPRCSECTKASCAGCNYDRQIQRRTNAYVGFSGVIDFKIKNAQDPAILILRIPSRTFINRILMFLQFPCPFTKEGMVPLLLKLAEQHSLRRRKVQATIPFSINDCELRLLVMRAETCFFETVNLTLGLFTREMYYSAPRSELLRYAVIASGLLFCRDHHPVQTQLWHSLRQSTLPTSLKMTLGNIQAVLLVIMNLCDAPWVPQRMDFFHTFCLRTAHHLGLPSPQTRTCICDQVERTLTYNFLAYRSHFCDLINIPKSLPLSLPKFNNSHLAMINSTPVGALYHSIANLNQILPQIIRLKNSLVDMPTPNPNPGKTVAKLISSLNKISLRALTSLYKLPPSREITALISLFCFYHYYYCFIVSSMRLFQTSNLLRSIASPDPEAKAESLSFCKSAIHWALKVQRSSSNWFLLSKYSQCLFFLQRNLAPEDEPLLKKGKDHYSSFHDYPFKRNVASKLALFNSITAI